MLYHPASAVSRTPASAGVAFDPVAFATTEAGVPRLKGWWIPAAPGARYTRYTVLYLHGQNGNMSNTVDDLAALHDLGLNILAFDYRGYGQSQFSHPTQARWREDAEWCLSRRSIPPSTSSSATRARGWFRLTCWSAIASTRLFQQRPCAFLRCGWRRSPA